MHSVALGLMRRSAPAIDINSYDEHNQKKEREKNATRAANQDRDDRVRGAAAMTTMTKPQEVDVRVRV